MGDDPDRTLLEQAARKAADLPFFVAWALRAYHGLRGIAEAELAELLGCPVESLPRLALCRRPDTTAAQFRAEVEQIAAYAGANSFPLARLLCAVASASGR